MKIESLLREMFNPGGIEEICQFVADALEWVKGDAYWKDKAGGLHSLLYNENFVQWGTNYQEGYQHGLNGQIVTSPLMFETGVEVSIYESAPQSLEDALQRANSLYGEYGQESAYIPLADEDFRNGRIDVNKSIKNNIGGDKLSKMFNLGNKLKDVAKEKAEARREKLRKDDKQNNDYLD